MIKTELWHFVELDLLCLPLLQSLLNLLLVVLLLLSLPALLLFKESKSGNYEVELLDGLEEEEVLLVWSQQ